MKAIIPVAGKGTRMRPHTLSHPKVLLPVAGKPMIAYILEELLQNNIRDVVFIVGYLGDRIKDYVVEAFPDLNCEFVEQKEMMGLGHAISLAAPFIHDDDEVFIILGDTLFDVNFTDMIHTPYSNLGVKYVQDPSRFGVAVTENEFITRLVEKPSEPISNLALVGLYYIKESRMLMTALQEMMQKGIKTRGEFQLTDALQIMLDKGVQMIPFNVDNWFDCGKPETLLDTTFVYLKKYFGKESARAVGTNSLMIPPVHIGENVTIVNSVIGPNVSINDGAIVENSVIQNSILFTGSSVKNAILDHSILGENSVWLDFPKKINIGDFSGVGDQG
ncbi:MAG: sugar phosphate nucleotidyltransferase [Calditrichia bacterium]